MATWIARLFAVAIVFSLGVVTMVALPWAISVRDKQITRWTADASGSAVPAAEPTYPHPPFLIDEAKLISNTNLSDGPGRGKKPASGSGRLVGGVGGE